MDVFELKSNSDIAAIPTRWLPEMWIVQNYSVIWDMMPFARFYLNSIIVGMSQTLGVLLISSLAAYGLPASNFGVGRRIFLYLSTIMIPGWVTLIPAFTIIRNPAG